MQKASALTARQSLHELIEASWQRCRQSGLGPHWHIDQDPLSSRQLQEKQEENRQMRRLALREMHLLGASLRDTGNILLLADSTGIILDSQGDDMFLGRARAASLMCGASWSENVVGTNAIGTAIIAQHFIHVVGRQHFFDENCFLACHAMPIMSPTGKLAGALDISGCIHDTFQSVGQLVRQAAAHIEHDWVVESATDLVVRLHQHPSWLGTPEEGVLTFHHDVLTGASSRALHALGLSPSAISRAAWGKIFSQRPVLGRVELRCVDRPGLFYADVSRTCSVGARIAATEQAHSGPENLADMRDEAFRCAVEAENGNISAAARRLGIHRSTLYRRLYK